MKTTKMTIHKVAQIQRALDGRIGTDRNRISVGIAHSHGATAGWMTSPQSKIHHARQFAWSRIVELNLHTA